MRYLLNFSYNGFYYRGFNKQKHEKTIQGEIEKHLSKRFNKNIKLVGCGRTDALVHSLDSFAHFDIDEKVDLKSLKKYLNSCLDGETYIKNISTVSTDFHARYNVKKKTYMYMINMGEFNPIEKDYVFQYCKKIDLKVLKKVSKKLVGRHSFKSFTPSSNIKENYEREIYEIKLVKKFNYLYIYITGNGFLRYMVRNIVGLMLDVNENKFTVNDVEKILKSEDRKKSGHTASAQGLYLYRVYY